MARGIRQHDVPDDSDQWWKWELHMLCFVDPGLQLLYHEEAVELAVQLTLNTWRTR